MDIEIQTDFRDVDIQTDPYIPDYLLSDESRKDVLPDLDLILHQREAARDAAVDAEVQRRKDAINQRLEATKADLQRRRARAARATAAQHPLIHPPALSTTEAAARFGPKGHAVESSALIPSTDANSTAPYDVRPTLLNFSDGLNEVARRAARVKASVLVPPKPLPEPAAALALTSADAASKDEIAAERLRVLAALYRATPQLHRPTTPTLVLDADQPDALNGSYSVEEVDRAAVLLQSLLRGRAVQNLFFEGRLRCAGLIVELQGASNAMASEAMHAVVINERNAQLGIEEFVDGVVANVCGVVASSVLEDAHTLLPHLRAAGELRALAAEGEHVRAEREAAELARRAVVVTEGRRRAATAAAIMDAASAAAQTLIDSCIVDAARGTARAAALAAADAADAAGEAAMFDAAEGEDEEAYATRLACSMMDALVLPQLRRRRVRMHGAPALKARAEAEAALEAVGDAATAAEARLAQR